MRWSSLQGDQEVPCSFRPQVNYKYGVGNLAIDMSFVLYTVY